MKLYTEQQVEEAYLSGRFTRLSFEEVLKEYTPIELPTDKEIKKLKIKNNRELEYISANEFIQHGAKWVIEQIKKQI